MLHSLYLDLPQLSGTLHPAGHIYCVAPYVILWLPGSNDSSYHWTIINACLKNAPI